jgi:hypothetical protein
MAFAIFMQEAILRGLSNAIRHRLTSGQQQRSLIMIKCLYTCCCGRINEKYIEMRIHAIRRYFGRQLAAPFKPDHVAVRLLQAFASFLGDGCRSGIIDRSQKPEQFQGALTH